MSESYTTTGSESKALNEGLKCHQIREATVTMDEHRELQKQFELINFKYQQEAKKVSRYRNALLRILDQE